MSTMEIHEMDIISINNLKSDKRIIQQMKTKAFCGGSVKSHF